MLPGAFELGVVSLGVAGGALCWLAVHAYREWGDRGAGAFSAFAAVLGVGALVLAADAALWGPEAVRRKPATFGRWYRLLFSVGLVGTVPWAAFALRYTGRDEELRLTTRRIGLASLPVFGLVGMTWVPGVIPARSPGSVVATGGVGTLLFVAAVVLGVYWLVGHLLGTVTMLRTHYVYDHLSTAQGGLVTMASLSPVVAIAVVGQIPADSAGSTAPVTVGIVAIGFLLSGIGIGVALFAYGAPTSAPAAGNVGRDTLFDEMDDLVITVDDDGRIVDVNGAVGRALSVEDPLGTPVEELLGVDLGELWSNETVRVPTPGGRRLFDPQVTLLPDHNGGVLGFAVILRDVTEREIRQQRLEVLNRVIRHNLRNKLTVVKGVADIAVDEDGSGPPPSLARDLSDAAEDLMTLGEKAREIEELMHGGSTPTTVDLEELVASVATDVRREYPQTPIRVAVPPELSVRVDESLLRCAMSNVLQVTATHDDEIEVGVEETSPPTVVVDTAGEGIPPHERAVIEDGKETPLDHASGLSLWAANWCVTRIGGELSFEGSQARILLPDRAPEGRAPQSAVVDTT